MMAEPKTTASEGQIHIENIPVQRSFNGDIDSAQDTTSEDADLFGTVQISEAAADAEVHGNHKVLVPTPSDDPDDPLVCKPALGANVNSITNLCFQNWSRRAKMTSLLCISTFAFLANVNSICFQPALTIIHEEFHVSMTESSFLLSLNVLMLGVGNLFWVPFMRKYGKRPMYIAVSD